jgi:hypothetical protein
MWREADLPNFAGDDTRMAAKALAGSTAPRAAPRTEGITGLAGNDGSTLVGWARVSRYSVAW